MQHFRSDGIDIAWMEEGNGDPILLVHGFGSTAHVNWVATGWVDTLVKNGRRVIAFDNRGHGASAKPHDPDAYHPARMAEDARHLLDHLAVPRADVMGYSMGGRIAAFLALEEPERLRSLILGGIGMSLVDGMSHADAVVAAMEAPSLADVAEEGARIYRKFADQNRADLAALAACMRGVGANLSAEQLAELDMPVLVAVGERDAVSGSGERLAALIPSAVFLPIPHRDHMVATGDRVFKQGTLAFLDRRP